MWTLSGLAGGEQERKKVERTRKLREDDSTRLRYNETARVYKKTNRDKVNQGQRERYWRRKNGLPPPPRSKKLYTWEEVREVKNAYQKLFRDTHTGTGDQADAARLCRTRIGTALAHQQAKKSGRSIALLGCTWKQLHDYLGPDFARRKELGLELDHIWPVKLYDVTDPTEQSKVFNYRNLRLCSGHENRTKNAAPPDPALAETVPMDLWPQKLWPASLYGEF